MAIDPDALFVGVYNELQARSQPRDLYENLACVRLLRQLLFDQDPLAERVNRTRRIKIRYRVTERNPPPQPENGPRLLMSIALDGLDPDTCLRANVKALSLKRDQFLRHPVMYNYGRLVSVHDLIRYAAHKLGGVHLDDKEDEEFARGIADDTFVYQVRATSRVTLKALKPLYRACRSSINRAAKR